MEKKGIPKEYLTDEEALRLAAHVDKWKPWEEWELRKYAGFESNIDGFRVLVKKCLPFFLIPFMPRRYELWISDSKGRYVFCTSGGGIFHERPKIKKKLRQIYTGVKEEYFKREIRESELRRIEYEKTYCENIVRARELLERLVDT